MATDKGLAGSDWSRYFGDQETVREFRNFHWEGSLVEYLDLVKKNPQITRNAFQRMYDMIMSWGTTSYIEYKKNDRPLQILRRPDRPRQRTPSTGSTSR